jgi:hypothetical protein
MNTKNTHYDGSKDSVHQQKFVPNKDAKGNTHPIRFDRLRPGSYFMIFAEPSRGIRSSNDKRVYMKHHNAFCAQHVSSTTACCLHPQDLVIPYRLVRV